MSVLRPYCLSIAGFDPSAGAGALADIKTFEQLKVYGLGVTTATTYQSDSEFVGLNWETIQRIENQIRTLHKYNVKAVKIGLVESFAVLSRILDIIDEVFARPLIVWDPVLKATAGFQIHDNNHIDISILKRIGLLTPNVMEFEALQLENNKATNILLKGGHVKNKGTDVLFANGNAIKIVGEAFEDGTEKHGTGCILSSAITAYLALGESLDAACYLGKQYVEKAMLSNNTKLAYHS